MTATEKAKAYLATLAPHVKDRKAASLIRELVAENEAQRVLIVRALNLRIRYLQLEGFRVPTWIAAQDVFGGNVDAARAICHRRGFDTDHEIGADE